MAVFNANWSKERWQKKTAFRKERICNTIVGRFWIFRLWVSCVLITLLQLTKYIAAKCKLEVFNWCSVNQSRKLEIKEYRNQGIWRSTIDAGINGEKTNCCLSQPNSNDLRLLGFSWVGVITVFLKINQM